PSTTAVINGAVAGLAGVTPASGFISPQNSFILGIVLGLASYYAILLLKEHWKIDDALDVSSVHGITGIIGALAIGIIASTVINPAGPNGLLYGNPMQLTIQALGPSACIVSCIGFPYNSPLGPAGLMTVLAMMPMASAPMMPVIPCTELTSSASSIFQCSFKSRIA